MDPYLPNYSFEKVLGPDLSATCYLAQHAQTHEQVCIKVIPKQQCRNEIMILKQVDHPSIVRFIDCIEDEAYFYLVEELIEGKDVFELVAEEGLTEKEAKKIFIQLLEAVEYLHSRNISHGDIKIENVMSNGQGNIKLIDFGYSNQTEEKLDFFGGTLEYAAPEILKGISFYGRKADLWSLGVFLFVLLVGEHPFNGSKKEIMEQIENGRIDFSGISSKEAEELIRKLLVVDPEGRRSVSEILRSPWFEEEEEKEIVDVFEEFALEDFSGSFEIFC